MIIFDNIISSLQSYGGITVYFDNLINRSPSSNILLSPLKVDKKYDLDMQYFKSRTLERYRDVPAWKGDEGVFHSSYYRLPECKANAVVTTVHDFTYEKFGHGLSKKIHTWQKNRAIINSDVVICISNNTANDLLNYVPVDEKKLVIIPNGVSKSYYRLSDLQCTNEVIFVGSRLGYKNFDIAVNALESHMDLSLTIVGGGPLTPSEVALLNKKLEGRYKHYSFLSEQDLNRLYNSSFCLFYPSSYEGFGIPIIEAMRAGCPVIASNFSSIPEVAGGAAILVDEINKGSFVNAIYHLKNSNTRENLIEEGIKNSQRYSWDSTYELTQKIYRELERGKI